ncbi:hypothetical protein BJ912DRAFT_965649 [Pholiota molesta]|nr:hypothetical protein BJ912DRAFT_965649 [Pholiota molesta]
MIVKTSSFSDSSDHDSSRNHSSLSSLVDSDFDNQEIPYDELRRQVSKIRTDHSTGKDVPYPELRSHTVDEWVSKFEFDLQVRSIPRSQWSNAAIIFLTSSGEVNMAMRERRHHRVQLGVLEWPWDEFKSQLYDALQNKPAYLQRFQQDHPTVTAVAAITAGTGLVIAGTTVLAPSLLVATLNTVGFTASGVGGGTLAAAIQSTFYGGATTGLFATCQSIGATAAVASGSAITSSIGAVAAGASILGFGKKKSDGQPPGAGSDGSSNTTDTPPPYQR